MALDHQRTGPLEELWRDAARLRRANSLEERTEKRLRVARRSPEERAPRLVCVDDRVPAGDAEARRLDHGQRTKDLRSASGGGERDHPAVGVPDEVRAGLQELLEPDGFVLEIDAVDIGPRWEAAAIRRDELEPLGERPLRRPGRIAVDDASVHEQEPGGGHVRERNELARKCGN